MKLRKNILTALLLAIGFVLHQVIPGLIGSMKFDLMLSFMFVAILISKDFRSTLLTGLVTGGITAMTTTFPGGQIANIVDKLATCLIVYLLIKIAASYKLNQLAVGITAFIGTIISGTVFLGTALFIFGLPAPFVVLFVGVILPTAFTNIFITLFVYNAAKLAIKAAGIKYI